MYKKILKAMGSAGGYQQRQPGIIHTLRYTCSCTYMGLFMAHVIMVFYHVIMVSENPYHMVENPYHMVENPYHMVQKPCDTGIYLLCTNKRKIIKITLQVGQYKLLGSSSAVYGSILGVRKLYWVRAKPESQYSFL